jgi:hypothetical protein
MPDQPEDTMTENAQPGTENSDDTDGHTIKHPVKDEAPAPEAETETDDAEGHTRHF